MNTRGVAGQGDLGVRTPPPAPEATREISAYPKRNALGVGVSVVTRVLGGSDVCVVGHTLHAFCV